MKTKVFLLALAAITSFAGCVTSYFDPPKADRVQIMRYDSTFRPSTTDLDVFGQIPPTRPYKVIALLTCEGRLDQEVVMTTAIYYKARQVGADGVINPNAVATHGDPTLHVADTVQKQVIMNPVGLEANNQRCVFRAYAFVYTDKQTTSTALEPL